MKTKKKRVTANVETSIDSLKKSEELAMRLRMQIIALARKAGRNGLTINEAERHIEGHKGHSISPRFSELVREGALVRVLIGYGKPTRRFPRGVCRYVTRYDEETGRNVVVHWVPGFAPTPNENASNSAPTSVAPSEMTHCALERTVGEYNG